MSDWGIIGDGQWGLALGRRLIRNGHRVFMVGVDAMKRPPKGIKHTTDLGQVLTGTERLIITVPISVLEDMLVEAGPHLRGDHRAVTTSRGLTPGSHLRGTEALSQRTAIRQLAVLAGAADANAARGHASARPRLVLQPHQVAG